MHICTFIHLFFIIAKVWVSFQDPKGNQNMQAPHLILHPSPQNKIKTLFKHLLYNPAADCIKQQIVANVKQRCSIGHCQECFTEPSTWHKTASATFTHAAVGKFNFSKQGEGAHTRHECDPIDIYKSINCLHLVSHYRFKSPLDQNDTCY